MSASGEQFRDHSERLPPWFRIRTARGGRYTEIRDLITSKQLHTVCRSAACPNQLECWNSGTATFLILGNVCTRGCRFCNIQKGLPPGPADANEPGRVADAVAVLGLQYAVVTSVTRDDLPDGGASLFAATIRAIRKKSPGCRVEVLVPDFQGSEPALSIVLDAAPDVLNHNIETVPSLYAVVRPNAGYDRSLELLQRAKAKGMITKTGLMLGLGETIKDVHSVLHDLRCIRCDILTLGQYLQPNRSSLPVSRYYRPEEFDHMRDAALELGFRFVTAGPLVRSSYHAERHTDAQHTSMLSVPSGSLLP